MSFLWFAIALVVIASLTWKAVGLAYSALIGSDGFTVIAPFSVAGNKDDTTGEGLALASALQSKLRLITAEQHYVTEELTGQRPTPAPGVAASQLAEPQKIETSTTPPISLPVLNVPDFNAQVAGVEFGRIMSWVYRTAAERSALKFAVTKTEKTATVSGTLTRDGKSSIYETVANTSDVSLLLLRILWSAIGWFMIYHS